MKISTARKILNKNGVSWSNYFDVCYVLENMTIEGNEKIHEALMVVKNYLVRG